MLFTILVLSCEKIILTHSYKYITYKKHKSQGEYVLFHIFLFESKESITVPIVLHGHSVSQLSYIRIDTQTNNVIHLSDKRMADMQRNSEGHLFPLLNKVKMRFSGLKFKIVNKSSNSAIFHRFLLVNPEFSTSALCPELTNFEACF